MTRPKPAVVRLRELEPGQLADFFALLAERTKGSTRDGKPFYTCRFRDRRLQVRVFDSGTQRIGRGVCIGHVTGDWSAASLA